MNNLKLCLGVSTAAFFPLSLEDTFSILEQQSWKGIELMPQSPEECRPEFADTLLELSEGRFDFCGIHFPQILAPFLYNPYQSAFDFGKQLCADISNLAGLINSSTIVVHGPWENMSTGLFLEATISNLRTLCDVGLKNGVIIALENTPSSPMGGHPEDMIDFAAKIDRPNLSFTVDITHAYQMGQDPMLYIEGLPHIAHVHASDFDLVTNERHTLPGQGAVEWGKIIKALHKMGFNGNFILELLPQTLGPDPVEGLKTSTALLNPHFEDW